MNKSTFLDVLRSKLIVKDIPEQEIQKYVDKYSSFFQSVSDEDFEKEFTSESDVDEIASTIADTYALKMLSSIGASGQTAPAVQAPVPSEQMNKTIVFDTEQQKNSAPVPDDGDEVRIYNGDLKRIKSDPEEELPKKKTVRKTRPKVKGTPAFWTLFIVTLPFTLPLICAFTLLIGVFYIAITAAIAAFIGCMLVAVAAGTAAALTGIINGIIKIASIPPVGWYELGLGLIIGGGAILVSLLIYIITVKLLPKLYGLTTKLAALVYRKIGDLYYNVKARFAE